MTKADAPIVARYIAAYARRGLHKFAAKARGEEAFRLVQSALAALELGTQRPGSPEWRRQKAAAHARVISRIGELGK